MIRLAAVILLLAGCAAQTAEAPKAEPQPVVVDSFCSTARKRTWAEKDTPASIAEADAWNRAIDRRCRSTGG